MKKRILVLTLFAASSCSFVDSAPSESASDVSDVSYSLYVSRSSLTMTEFEQYKLLPTGLFSECGTIHRGRAETRQQGLDRVDQEQLDRSRAIALKIFESITAPEPPPADAPGANSSLADPGKYSLTISVGPKGAELKTSFDFVENQRTSLAADTRAFTEILRGLPTKVLCGNHDFYGINRR